MKFMYIKINLRDHNPQILIEKNSNTEIPYPFSFFSREKVLLCTAGWPLTRRPACLYPQNDGLKVCGCHARPISFLFCLVTELDPRGQAGWQQVPSTPPSLQCRDYKCATKPSLCPNPRSHACIPAFY